MNTVGIITYHHYYNYGTMLQAFALQYAVSKLGYNSEIIDFKQDMSVSHAELIKLRIRRFPVYMLQHKKYSTLAMSRGKIAEVEKSMLYNTTRYFGSIFSSTMINQTKDKISYLLD